MLERLDTLEAKIAQLVERYQAARDDNTRLRQQVLNLETSNRLLNERLDTVRTRMESLYDKLPD
jgi:outer membrane murein-binding lipoprotein Lpp